jgi:hypothetical protein
MPLSERSTIGLEAVRAGLKRESTKACLLLDAMATPKGSSRPVTKRVWTRGSIGAAATAVEQLTMVPFGSRSFEV